MPLKSCDTCGNEIPLTAGVCPFCRRPQGAAGEVALPKTKLLTLNLKDGMPTADEALARLDRELGAALQNGVRLLRLIHGYGSTGTGGVIRDSVRTRLRELHHQGTVRSFLPGENYSRNTEAGRLLLANHPQLAFQERTDTANPGITLVDLS
jgi:hypothetical protein